MDLFICNASPRNHHLHYRLPENQRPYDRQIVAGSQVKITGTQVEVDYIINQLSVYGLVKVNEIGRNPDFSGLCYALDKPVDLDGIRSGLDQVDLNAIEKALEVRKAGAVAADQTMSNLAQQAGVGITSMEVEVVEQSKGPSDTDAKFHQTITVEKEGREPSRRSRKN